MMKLKLYLRLYKRPEKTGWLGWIELANKEAVGFVKLNGSIVRWKK